MDDQSGPTDQLLNDLLRESLLEKQWKVEAALEVAAFKWKCAAQLLVGGLDKPQADV